MARIPFNTTIDERTRDKILELAVEKSQGRVVDEAVALLAEGKPKFDAGEIVEKLDSLSRVVNEELVEQVAETLELVSSIPGVARGAQNLQPRRESGHDRVLRENREREARARARSSIGDDPSFCVDGDFSQE